MSQTSIFTLRPEHPVTLALLRITVCALVLASPEVLTAPQHALLPAALRAPPEGLGWFVAYVPISPPLARAAQLGVAIGAFAGLVGYRAPLAMGMVSVFGFYTFALSQFDGAVLHDMHVLWFATVLAVSPCADALAPGARGWRAAHGPSVAYAVPLAVVRALFSAIYFFPGVWKLRASGLSWALSDNLRNQMYAKWFEWGGWLPALRIDQHPFVLRAAALSVLVFELSFPLLMIHRHTRVAAALGGIAFHLASGFFMRIHFPALWLCYVVLIDWGPLVDRLGGRPESVANDARPPSRRAAPIVWVGALLVGAGVVQGVRGATFAWPFGCYPTFQWKATTHLPDLDLQAQFEDGRAVTIDSGGHGRGRSQNRWGAVWSLAGLTHGPPSEIALRTYWNSLERARASGAVRGTVRRVTWSVLPEDRDRAPLTSEVMADFALDPHSATAL
jgi:hypothetical protein